MVERFAPGVVDRQYGCVYHPPGWMWVLGFAFGGCEWAILEADTPEFHERMRAWLVERQAANIEALIADYERRLTKLRTELNLLRSHDVP